MALRRWHRGDVPANCSVAEGAPHSNDSAVRWALVSRAVPAIHRVRLTRRRDDQVLFDLPIVPLGKPPHVVAMNVDQSNLIESRNGLRDGLDGYH